MFKGWRTVIFNVVTFVVTFGTVALQYLGAFGFTAEQTAQAMIVANAIIIAGNLYLRSITNSPMGENYK